MSRTQDDNDPEKPLKDYGSFCHKPGLMSDDDISAHHTEKWQDQPMFIGLRYPEDRKRRRKPKHRRLKSPTTLQPNDSKASLTASSPSQRVLTILERDSDEDNDEHHTHEIFCEMDELRKVGDEGDLEWKETARWIRFEEDVEEGGERWSKPHVATLSLHALFELRRFIVTGTIMLDVDATTIQQITDLILENMVASAQLAPDKKEEVRDILLIRHRHQFQKKEGKGLPMIRSLADIGRKASGIKIDKENTAKQSQGLLTPGSTAKLGGSNRELSTDISREGSTSDVSENSSFKYDQHFLKKIPPGAETSNILIGEVDGLSNAVVAFLRLQKAVLLGDVTEVPVPTRFIFILLGPVGEMKKYREVGRSIATLMSDEIFHDVAYKSHDRNDLLAGLDEFLDCVTVLPPGEWDPTIRIEPPKSVPSQEKRKKAPAENKKEKSTDCDSA